VTAFVQKSMSATDLGWLVIETLRLGDIILDGKGIHIGSTKKT